MNNTTILVANLTNNVTLDETTAASGLETDESYDTFHMITFALACIGITFNALSVLVLRNVFWRSSFNFYFSLLSLFDMIFLITGPLVLMVYGVRGMHPYDIFKKYYCTLHGAFVNFLSECSTWILMALTVDRYVAICHPLKAANFCSVRFKQFYISACLVILAAANFPFICHSWDPISRKYAFPMGFDEVCAINYKWLSIIRYYILPAFIIVIMNSLIIRKLRLVKDWRARILQNADNQNIKQIGNTIGVLLIVSCMFVILMSPLFVKTLLDNANIIEFENGHSYWVDNIIALCLTLNHSCNFFVYFMAGSSFRKKVKDLIGSRCRKTTERDSSVFRIGTIQTRHNDTTASQ